MALIVCISDINLSIYHHVLYVSFSFLKKAYTAVEDTKVPTEATESLRIRWKLQQHPLWIYWWSVAADIAS